MKMLKTEFITARCAVSLTCCEPAYHSKCGFTSFRAKEGYLVQYYIPGENILTRIGLVLNILDIFHIMTINIYIMRKMSISEK